MTAVSGEGAKGYRVVRLDTLQSVHKDGTLVSADESTGTVVYKDTPDSTKTVVFGMGAIRILPR